MPAGDDMAHALHTKGVMKPKNYRALSVALRLLKYSCFCKSIYGKR